MWEAINPWEVGNLWPQVITYSFTLSFLPLSIIREISVNTTWSRCVPAAQWAKVFALLTVVWLLGC